MKIINQQTWVETSFNMGDRVVLQEGVYTFRVRAPFNDTVYIEITEENSVIWDVKLYLGD